MFFYVFTYIIYVLICCGFSIVTKNVNLEELDCSGNKLTNIDITNNIKLDYKIYINQKICVIIKSINSNL